MHQVRRQHGRHCTTPPPKRQVAGRGACTGIAGSRLPRFATLSRRGGGRIRTGQRIGHHATSRGGLAVVGGSAAETLGRPKDDMPCAPWTAAGATAARSAAGCGDAAGGWQGLALTVIQLCYLRPIGGGGCPAGNQGTRRPSVRGGRSATRRRCSPGRMGQGRRGQPVPCAPGVPSRPTWSGMILSVVHARQRPARHVFHRPASFATRFDRLQSATLASLGKRFLAEAACGAGGCGGQ
jgi:hypothetical protein